MSPNPDILITIETDLWPPQSEAWGERAVRAVLAFCGIEGISLELGVTFSDDATVRVLNNDYRGQDKPTNVLSFPLTDGHLKPEPAGVPVMLGDVILAGETMIREAAEQGKSLADHTLHLVVHGVLHLLGHDHDTEDKAFAMETLETAILATLGVADPYAVTSSPDRP